MTSQEKAKTILQQIDEVYTVPTYLEERVERQIIKALNSIEAKVAPVQPDKKEN